MNSCVGVVSSCAVYVQVVTSTVCVYVDGCGYESVSLGVHAVCACFESTLARACCDLCLCSACGVVQCACLCVYLHVGVPLYVLCCVYVAHHDSTMISHTRDLCVCFVVLCQCCGIWLLIIYMLGHGGSVLCRMYLCVLYVLSLVDCGCFMVWFVLCLCCVL